MATRNLHTGVIVDDEALTLDELARACKVDPRWIAERVKDDILKGQEGALAGWRFTSAELIRVRRLKAVERDFDANPVLAGLVVDLMEELDRLKRQLLSSRR